MADRDPSTFLNSSAQARADNPAPPEAPKVKAAAPAATPSSAGSGALPPSGPSAETSPRAEAGGPSSSTYTVSEGDNGAHDIFDHTDDGPQKLGTSMWGKKDLDSVMGAAGAIYDKDHGVYSNVPENVAKVLAEGPQSLAGEVKHRLNAGMIEFHRAALGVELAGGKLSAEDLRQRTHPDLVQLQLDRHPAQAWHGLGDAVSKFMEHPVDEGEDLMKRSITATAEALPSLADLAGKATLGTAIGGTAAAFFGPEAIPVGMHVGGAAGTFLSLYNQELGSRMAGLADRGLNDKDIHKQAPVEAVKSAVGAGIYMYGVEAMAAPFKARFLQSLGDKAAEPIKTLTEKMASWAYNYGVNAGIKMPAVGIVHQMTSDLMDNMSALVEKRPDLMKSPMDFSNNAIEAAAGMAKLGIVAGVPGLAFEAGLGALDHAAESKSAAETTERLKGVERREPSTPSGPQGPSSPSGNPSGERTPGPSEQKASSELSQGTPPAPPENPSPATADLKSPLPDSITEHPAYVKAAEAAKADLPPGVEPTDRQGVIDAYLKAAQDAHDFKNEAMGRLVKTDEATGKKSMIELTPDEENQISAQMDHLAMKMRNLQDLAIFARDPEAEAAHRDWLAGGREGTEPPHAVDPYSEDLAKKMGMPMPGAPGAAPSTLPAVGPSDAELEKSMNETLANKDASANEVVKATSDAAARLDEKAQEATVKARAEAVKTEHEALKQRIGEIASTRDRMQKNGLSTRAIDRQLNTLLDKAVGLQKEGELLARRAPEELMVSPKAKLQMKPATLQNIMEAGFKEGGKQSQERARELLKIAEDNGLTANDVKKLIGNKSIGAMGDVAYRNFVDGFEREVEGKEPVRTPGFKEGVEKLVERKKARAEVAQVLQEKQLEKEQYIRQLNKLPPFSKMTTEQLKSYADILRSYDKADTALSPKFIEALNGTKFKDVKTEGEMIERASKLTGIPAEDLKNVRVPLKARAIPDPQLRTWFPALRPFVDLAGELSEKGDRLAEIVRDRNEAFAADAIRERRALQGAGTRAADFFAPQQSEVMAYLEAKEPGDIAAAAEKLTPAEMKWANFLKAWFGTAEDYLVKKQGMESRFSGAYAPHVNKGWPEILRDLKDQGLAASLKEFLPQAQGKNADFVDAQGNVLGFNKFFKQSIFRTGALDPSKNVVEAANHYISDFYRKAALDEIAPTLVALARAMKAPPEEGVDLKESEAMTSSIQDFVKAWVNNKKGINNSAGAVGELMAPALRMSQTLASIHYIAANYALQAIKGAVAIPTSEYMALGTDLFKAKALKYTDQGRAILSKYESFTGKSPWEEVSRPGADANDFARALSYGGFGMAHKTAMEDLLLGSMTKEEFAKGEISDARLNQIRQEAGRWMDLSRSDSIMGSSAPGKAFTQYKGWAIPPTLTLAENAAALARQVAGKGKMNDVQVRETLRLVSLAAVAGTVGTLATKDMEDDSFRGQAIHYLRRAVGSMWRGLDPAFFFSAAGPGYVAKLATDLHLLGTLERDKNDELKGVKALKRDLTPRLVKDVEKNLGNE